MRTFYDGDLRALTQIRSNVYRLGRFDAVLRTRNARMFRRPGAPGQKPRIAIIATIGAYPCNGCNCPLQNAPPLRPADFGTLAVWTNSMFVHGPTPVEPNSRGNRSSILPLPNPPSTTKFLSRSAAACLTREGPPLFPARLRQLRVPHPSILRVRVFSPGCGRLSAVHCGRAFCPLSGHDFQPDLVALAFQARVSAAKRGVFDVGQAFSLSLLTPRRDA